MSEQQETTDTPRWSFQEYLDFWKGRFNEAERLHDYDRGIHLLVLLKETCEDQIRKMEKAKA